MIRVATLDDIDWLVDTAIKDMFNLLGKPEIYNKDYLKNILVPSIIEQGIALVSEGEGAILGFVTPHPYNPDYVIATESMWWVREDKRGSSLGYRLLKEFEQYAKEIGANYVVLSLMGTSTVSSLKKSGYSQIESSFIKEV
jgi:N-acetylglutamate synthase-like GNAT family acetyltransferase